MTEPPSWFAAVLNPCFVRVRRDPAGADGAAGQLRPSLRQVRHSDDHLIDDDLNVLQ